MDGPCIKDGGAWRCGASLLAWFIFFEVATLQDFCLQPTNEELPIWTTQPIEESRSNRLPASGLLTQHSNHQNFLQNYHTDNGASLAHRQHNMPSTPAAGLPAMAKQSTPKTMSNRLAAMKFMQRGAAAAAAAAATRTPEASPAATPRSDASSTKRRKMSHTPSSAAGSPAAAFYDNQAIKAAVEEEEKRNHAAVERRAAELGDSHWVLEGAATTPARGSRPLLNVVQVGFTQIDHAAAAGGGDDDDDPFDMGSVPAQPQFQRFNMKKSKAGLLPEGNPAVRLY
jgi:hypothetical protein